MNFSIHQIFEHLCATHGNMTELDLHKNEEKMRQPWNQEQPIETAFQQLEEVIHYEERGNLPFANNQILSEACVIMAQAKVFQEPRIEWRRKT